MIEKLNLPKLSSDCTLPALLNPWHWKDPPRSAWAFWMVRLEVLTRKPHCVMWKTARPCPLWEPLMTGVPCHVHWIEGSGLASTSHWSTTCHRSWGLTFDRTIREPLFASLFCTICLLEKKTENSQKKPSEEKYFFGKLYLYAHN